MLVEQLVQRAQVAGVELGELDVGLRLDHRRHQGLFLGAQAVPQRLVHHDAGGGAGLVEARIEIVLGDLVEAEGEVVPGADPFRGVDGARCERGVDFRHRQVDDRDAERAQHLAADARHAELQALEVVQLLDRLAVPAAHLGAGAGALEALEVELGRELVPELLPAAIFHPGGVLDAGQPVGHGGEEVEALVLALPVILGRMVHVGVAGADGVEHAESRHQLAAAIDLDLDLAAGELRDAPGDPLPRRAQARRVERPGHGQLPLLEALRDGRGRQRRCGGGDAGGRGALNEFTAFHGMSSLLRRERNPIDRLSPDTEEVACTHCPRRLVGRA